MLRLISAVAFAGLIAVAAQPAVAKPGGGHGGGNSGGAMRGLDRADYVAGSHGAYGRANARTRGMHRTGFCPPGHAKQGRC